MGELISTSDIGVVIQGPIQSVGRILTDLKFRPYDSTSDVKTMLQTIINLGSKPIVVTWQDQNIDEFSFNEKEYIMKIPFPRVTIWKSLINDWNNNSKYRQYYSTLIGTLELKNRGCKYVIKLRTDNLVDIRQLISFVLSLDPLEAEKYFYSPLINLDKPHMFFDFYSFSTTSKMEKFCNVMLYEKERTTNVHFDVFYRWTKHELKSKYSLSDINLIYPKYPFFTQAQLRLIREGLKEVFRPLPKEIWTSLYWRGEQLGAKGLKDQYRFADTPAESILSNFDDVNYKKPDKASINYLSIPSFFITSRLELHLNRTLAKLIRAKITSTQFLRKISNSRQKPII
jgi:hypothetical protein